MYLDFVNFFNNRFSICSSENKTLFGSVFKLLIMLFTRFKNFLSSIFSFPGKIIRSKWVFNIKFVVYLITESFNCFVQCYFLIFFFVVSNISILFNIFQTQTKFTSHQFADILPTYFTFYIFHSISRMFKFVGCFF